LGRKKKIVPYLSISGFADKGRAVGRSDDGEVIFINGAVPGDVVEALILRKKKSFSEGIVHKMLSLSKDRVTPLCMHFSECGGCKWQDLDYSAQLIYKEANVKDCIKRIAKLDEDIVKPILGCDQQIQYRNKLEYSASSKRWITKVESKSSDEIINTGAFGFHKTGYFDKIVPIENCLLQDSLTNDIRNFVRDYVTSNSLSFYDYRDKKGFLRNLIVRNTVDGQWMVIVIFGVYDEKHVDDLMDKLKNRFPQITSLHYIINEKQNDSIWDQKVINPYGKPYILEKLGNISYKIGPKSFFQTNPTQAKTLFDVAIAMAELKKTDIVYDLYTGLGSIALYIANKVSAVIGIEEIPEAINDANENKAINNISNATFYAGDVKDILNDTFIMLHGKPDVVITDPPRAGMHEKVIETLLTLEAPRIVYISCNPSTQARDLALLSNKYNVLGVQPVDMFPHTHHIETVALLTLIKH
jgi:23S rRNA (uracil1939-C5)-methyltransferase